jgi:hypothetical protein
MSVTVKEKTFFENPTDLQLKFNKKDHITMYPDIEYKLSVDYTEPKVNLKSNESFFGKITFISPRNNNMEYSKILSIKNKE